MSFIEHREAVVLTNQGQKIFGILHLPKGVEASPCVVICHGLGGHKTGRYRVYVELATALIKRNIAVFRFDFRGSGDSEGDFSDMTLEGEIADALVALHFLAGDSRIDAQRMGIFGRSFGGAVAVHTAVRFGKIKSLALWAPIFNGEQWQNLWVLVRDEIASPEESAELRRINGQVAGIPFYAEMFGMRLEKELEALIDIPMLLVHGEKDEIVLIKHSEMYEKKREQAIASTSFIRLPNCDHDFTLSREREFAVQATADWFSKTL